jgi:pyruvate kinase
LLGLPNDKPIEFTRGSEVYITANRHINRSSSVLYCDYANLPYQVKPGDKILVENGKASFTVKKIERECDTILGVNSSTFGKEVRVIWIMF